MPADAMIVSAAVISIFVIFAAVLYWGEQTRSLPKGVSEEAKTRRRSF